MIKEIYKKCEETGMTLKEFCIKNKDELDGIGLTYIKIISYKYYHKKELEQDF